MVRENVYRNGSNEHEILEKFCRSFCLKKPKFCRVTDEISEIEKTWSKDDWPGLLDWKTPSRDLNLDVHLKLWKLYRSEVENSSRAIRRKTQSFHLVGQVTSLAEPFLIGWKSRDLNSIVVFAWLIQIRERKKFYQTLVDKEKSEVLRTSSVSELWEMRHGKNFQSSSGE